MADFKAELKSNIARLNTYSPGLLTSTLYLVVFYLVARYGVGGHLISATDFAIGVAVVVATIGAFLTVGPTVLMPRLTRASSLAAPHPKP
jgi:hypothetical protein